MANVFGDGFFDDDWSGYSAQCSPITQAELDNAESFDAMIDSTPINLVARIEEEESREINARTDTKTITGDGPVLFASEVFSMHRLLWADGTMQVKGKRTTRTTTTKATFAAFKINLDSHTKSSGAGKDKAVHSARIQVEFHGTNPKADPVDVQRPVVVGWAPFATMERPNETTAQKSRSRSVGASLRGGATQAGATLEGSASDTRAWQQRYFDSYRSWPVSVVGSRGESSNYNGVAWMMEQNSLAREGVVPELLVYLLVTRQDDREYAVRITADVHRAGFYRHRQHRCGLRVRPGQPSRERPAVCYLEGEKMWKSLNVDNFEALLSPNNDPGLVLPWEVEDTTSTKAGTRHGGDSENEAAEAEVEAEGGDDNNADEEENEDAAEAGPNATLNVAVPLTTERLADRMPAEPKPGRDAARPLADKAVWDALLGLFEDGDGHGKDEVEDEDLPTRMAILESRMEVMEHRMARQALVIRALLKRRGR